MLSVGRAWTVFNTKNQGIETKSYLFQMKGRAPGEPKRVNGQAAVETIDGLVADDRASDVPTLQTDVGLNDPQARHRVAREVLAFAAALG